MSSLRQLIKENIEIAQGKRQPKPPVNPLVTIGLSDAILNLPIPPESLYKIVMSYLRQLIGQIHPDANQTTESPEVVAIREAADQLKDVATFRIALTEFRTIRNEAKRERQVLVDANKVLCDKISALEDRLDPAKEHSLKARAEQLTQRSMELVREENAQRAAHANFACFMGRLLYPLKEGVERMEVPIRRLHRYISKEHYNPDSVYKTCHVILERWKMPGLHSLEASIDAMKDWADMVPGAWNNMLRLKKEEEEKAREMERATRPH